MKSQKRDRLLVWLLLLGLMIGGPSPHRVQAQADTRLGTMIIAVASASPPFAAKASNGHLVGFDLDLIKKIARTAGLRVTYEDAPFTQLIPGVSTHLYDAAISCIFVNDERRVLVNFSETYFTTGMLLVVHQNNNTIYGLEDLTPETFISTVESTAYETFVTEQTESAVTTLSTVNQALESVNNGTVDATVVGELDIETYRRTYPDTNLKTVGALLQTDQCAIAVNKDNPRLLVEVNAALTRLKNNGKYLDIYRRWFGTRPLSGPSGIERRSATPIGSESLGEEALSNGALFDLASGLYEITLSTDPPTYQTIEIAPEGRWQETMLPDVAARIQRGVPLDEVAIPLQQVGQWQLVTEDPQAIEIEIQATVPLTELLVADVESSDSIANQAITRIVSTPIGKEYTITIAPDGTLNGSYTLYTHQTLKAYLKAHQTIQTAQLK